MWQMIRAKSILPLLFCQPSTDPVKLQYFTDFYSFLLTKLDTFSSLHYLRLLLSPNGSITIWNHCIFFEIGNPFTAIVFTLFCTFTFLMPLDSHCFPNNAFVTKNSYYCPTHVRKVKQYSYSKLHLKLSQN